MCVCQQVWMKGKGYIRISGIRMLMRMGRIVCRHVEVEVDVKKVMFKTGSVGPSNIWYS